METRIGKYLHAKGRQLGTPVAGTFELTPRCNFNCKMCYVHLTQEEQRSRGRELTADEWIGIGEDAKNAGMIFLLLTGGEPTLRPDFPEIFEQLKKKGLVISINSNGLLLDGALRRLLCENPPSRINITLYGISNETYERQCGLPAYDRVIENIRVLREAGVDVKINMSVTPDNCTDIQAVHDKAKELGAQIQATPYMFPPIRLHPECFGQNFRMDPLKAGTLIADNEAANKSEERLRKQYEAIKNGRLLEEDTDEDCMGTEADGMRCRGGKTAFWIDWDGKLLPCGQMVAPAADVLSLGFDEAWRQVRTSAADIRLPMECTVCKLKNICHPCAAMCYCETGRFDGKPEYVCRMRHRYCERLLEICKERFG